MYINRSLICRPIYVKRGIDINYARIVYINILIGLCRSSTVLFTLINTIISV